MNIILAFAAIVITGTSAVSATNHSSGAIEVVDKLAAEWSPSWGKVVQRVRLGLVATGDDEMRPSEVIIIVHNQSLDELPIAFLHPLVSLTFEVKELQSAKKVPLTVDAQQRREMLTERGGSLIKIPRRSYGLIVVPIQELVNWFALNEGDAWALRVRMRILRGNDIRALPIVESGEIVPAAGNDVER